MDPLEDGIPEPVGALDGKVEGVRDGPTDGISLDGFELSEGAMDPFEDGICERVGSLDGKVDGLRLGEPVTAEGLELGARDDGASVSAILGDVDGGIIVGPPEGALDGKLDGGSAKDTVGVELGDGVFSGSSPCIARATRSPIMS